MIPRPLAAVVFACLLLPGSPAAQDAPAAPTAKPAAAPPAANLNWQRSLADALAEQARTGKPLLLCVNMDGETFCDNFASTTYHDPAFVAVSRGWICLVASPTRHNDMDYDAQGQRVECPRFPGCTCSEHINVEPGLFERWFHGQRAAPRHVGVDRAGKVLFDRFLDGSMQTAIDAVKNNAGDQAVEAVPTTVDELLTRRGAEARRALEQRYRQADRGQRLELLVAAGRSKNEPFDLLRMGLRDDDDGVFAAAAAALAATAGKDALVDVEDALARTDQAALVKTLDEALARLAKSGDAACIQADAHRRAALAGLAVAAAPPFAGVKGAPAGPAIDRQVLDHELDDAESAVEHHPNDGAASLRLARAFLALAESSAAAGAKETAMQLEDAERAAQRAIAALGDGAAKVEALSVACCAAALNGKTDEARRHGDAALAAARATGSAETIANATFGKAMAALGRATAAAAYLAVQSKPTAVAADDVTTAATAFAIAAQRVDAAAPDLLADAQLLAFAGARQQGAAVLLDAAARFPAARDVHQALRERLVADRGGEGLRRVYAHWVDGVADQATAQWFAGYAAIVAAELHVKDGRPMLARAAYDDCIARFATSAAANADYADSANHFAVLALVGRALLRHNAGDAGGVLADVQAAVALRRASLGEVDGLGRRGLAVFERIGKELRDRGKTDVADAIAAALQ
jgi:hypothetical protein